MYNSKAKSTVNIEELIEETITESNSFYFYANYIVGPDEEKIQMIGINGNDDVMAVYENLNSFFKPIRHKADFDKLYEEEKCLVDIVRRNVVVDKAEKVI